MKRGYEQSRGSGERIRLDAIFNEARKLAVQQQTALERARAKSRLGTGSRRAQTSRSESTRYRFQNAVNMALETYGVRGYAERTRLFFKVHGMIEAEMDDGVAENVEYGEDMKESPSWKPDIFSKEGRAWGVAQAREHMKEWPDPEEFEREWEG